MEDLKQRLTSRERGTLFLYVWSIVESVLNLFSLWSLGILQCPWHIVLIICIIILERAAQVITSVYYTSSSEKRRSATDLNQGWNNKSPSSFYQIREESQVASPPSPPSPSAVVLAEQNRELLMRMCFLDVLLHHETQQSIRVTQIDACYYHALRVHNIFASVSSCFCLIVHLHALVASNKSNALLIIVSMMHILSLSFSNTTWFIQEVSTRPFISLFLKNLSSVLGVFPIWALAAASILPPKFLVIHILLATAFIVLLYFSFFHQRTLGGAAASYVKLPPTAAVKSSSDKLHNSHDSPIQISKNLQAKHLSGDSMPPLASAMREELALASTNQLVRWKKEGGSTQPLPLTPSRVLSASFALDNPATAHAEFFSDNHLTDKRETSSQMESNNTNNHLSNKLSKSSISSNNIKQQEIPNFSQQFTSSLSNKRSTNDAFVEAEVIILREEEQSDGRGGGGGGGGRGASQIPPVVPTTAATATLKQPKESIQFHSPLYDHWLSVLVRLLLCAVFLNVSFNGNASFLGIDSNTPVCTYKILNLAFLLVFELSFNDIEQYVALRTIACIAAALYFLCEVAYIADFDLKRTVFYEGYLLFCTIFARNNKETINAASTAATKKQQSSNLHSQVQQQLQTKRKDDHLSHMYDEEQKMNEQQQQGKQQELTFR